MDTHTLLLGLGGLGHGHHLSELMASPTLQTCHAIWLQNAAACSPKQPVLAQHVVVRLPERATGHPNLADATPLDHEHADVAVSRRAVCEHFEQHQQLLWQACHAQLHKRPVNEVWQCVLLIDVADALASSIYWTCLRQLRARYPAMRLCSVFLLPAHGADTTTNAARVGAVLAEMSAWGRPQKAMTAAPSLVRPVTSSAHWDVAYMQPMPEDGVWVEGMEDLLQQLMWGDEVAGGKHVPTAPAKHGHTPSLPRFLSTSHASVQWDETALAHSMQQTLTLQLLRHWGHPMTSAVTADTPVSWLLQQGWVVDEDSLLLNRPTLEGAQIQHESVLQEWQTRAAFLTQQLTTNPSQAWDEQAQELALQFQKIFDKQFRSVGAGLFYSVSQSRLERLAALHAAAIETAMWQHCHAGHCQLADMGRHLMAVFGYYQNVQERFEIEQRQADVACQKHVQAWQTLLQQWQTTPKRNRLSWQQDHPMSALVANLVTHHVDKCRHKALTFALSLLEHLLPHYQRLQQTLQDMATWWQQQAQLQEANLHQQLATQARQWIKHSRHANHHRYLLQPNSATVSELASAALPDGATWAHDMELTWFKRLGAQGNFALLGRWLQQKQWQPLLQRIVTDISTQALQTWALAENSPLQAAFEQRLANLSQRQWQQLGQHAHATLQALHQQHWHNLGTVLSADHTAFTQVSVRCSATLNQQNKVAAWAQAWGSDHVDISPISGSCRLQWVLSRACGVQEWRHLPAVVAAYEQVAQHPQAGWALHLDGDAKSLQHLSAQLQQRNRDVVRPHLLLALLCGQLAVSQSGCRFQCQLGGPMLTVAATNLNELVEAVPLEVVVQLVDSHQHLRAQQRWQGMPEMRQQLEQLLAQLRQQCLPVGVDLADADWQVAGRYVVWTRAAQTVRKQWLQAQTPQLTNTVLAS